MDMVDTGLIHTNTRGWELLDQGPTLTWSAGLQSRGFQPMVSRWDPALQSFWPAVPSGLLAFDDAWPRDTSIPPKHFKDFRGEVIISVRGTGIERRRCVMWTTESEQKNWKLGPYNQASSWCKSEWFITRKPADFWGKGTGNAWYIMWETGSSSSCYFSMASPGEFSERALQRPQETQKFCNGSCWLLQSCLI